MLVVISGATMFCYEEIGYCYELRGYCYELRGYC